MTPLFKPAVIDQRQSFADRTVSPLVIGKRPAKPLPPVADASAGRPAGYDLDAQRVYYHHQADGTARLVVMTPSEIVAIRVLRTARWPDEASSAPDINDDPEPPPDWQPMTYVSHSAQALAALPRSACRFGIGDPGEPGFRWCGAPVAPESSYCDEHHSECWRPAGRQS